MTRLSLPEAGGPGGRAARGAGRARLSAPRAAVHAVLSRRRLPAVRAALPARRLGRQAGSGAAPATRAPPLIRRDAAGSRRPGRARCPAADVAVGGAAGAQTRAAPAGTFGRGTLEGRAYRVWRAEPAGARAPADRGAARLLADAGGLRARHAPQRGRRARAASSSSIPPRAARRTRIAAGTGSTRPSRPPPAARRRRSSPSRAACRPSAALREPRVVVIGFSAGGWMAVNLACAAPELVVGVGAVAGGPYRCAGGAEAAIQCMRGHGARPGGRGGGVPCAAASRAPACASRSGRARLDTVVSPANLHRCWRRCSRASWASAAAPDLDRRSGAVHAVYRDRARRAGAGDLAGARAWATPGAAAIRAARHAWPPGPPATDRMLDFLRGAALAVPGQRRLALGVSARRGRAGHRRLSAPGHVVGRLDPRRSPRPASSAAWPTGSR